jgi:hypothetical protein
MWESIWDIFIQINFELSCRLFEQVDPVWIFSHVLPKLKLHKIIGEPILMV